MAEQLTPDEQAALAQAGEQIKAIRDTIARLKRIGVDVSAEEEALDRAEQIRRGFLREFGGPGRARTGRTS